jgi:eukaryotic-like serine/threonine-protein kinase
MPESLLAFQRWSVESPDRDPLDSLADEFAARCRRGESPSIAEYAAAHPCLASRIEELFPAVAMLERWRIDEEATRRAVAVRDRFARAPERLGDFVIVRELGRGGMGIVYEAEQRSLARRVAVKILPKHVLLLDKHLQRFQREAQTAARLRHTNIVPVFGAGEHEGLHYYVMPLVRGVGLDEVIGALRTSSQSGGGDSLAVSPGGESRGAVAAWRRCRWRRHRAAAEDVRYDSVLAEAIVRRLVADKFPQAAAGPVGGQPAPPPRALPPHDGSAAPAWRWVAQIGLQAAEALGYAHAQGTLHRDIKPGNLLIDEDGNVSVADFGLARTVERAAASPTSELAGTLRYMAPEQRAGRAEERSDVFALGLTIYELLTLQAAAADPTRGPALDGQTVVLPPRKFDATIPRDLETIVLKCLAAEPARRYQSAEALASDLRCCLQDQPIRARRVSWRERAGRWWRRNPALAAMSALAGLLLMAVVAIAVRSDVRTRRAYTEATRALAQAETTAQLARQALDSIYDQFAPERARIAAHADRPGASRGVPHRAGAPIAASPEVAAVLGNLLVYYDRLAEQIPADRRLLLDSLVAARRVGDIRQRLGQLERAEREYRRVADRLAALPAPADLAVQLERARIDNELGNVCSARCEFGRAHQFHRQALNRLHTVETAHRAAADYRYEFARTCYFLANKRLGAWATRRDSEGRPLQTPVGPHHFRSSEYRATAIAILEDLTHRQPAEPDYRFLLALCHRLSEIGPPTDRSIARIAGRRRARQVLEELKTEYPEVADYRYELAVTWATDSPGLFPWEDDSVLSATTEVRLLRAMDELDWLVAQRPAIPEYAWYRALVLAKLGVCQWRSGQLAAAEGWFQQSFQAQHAVVHGFPGLPPHQRVQLELIQLRWAQVCLARGLDEGDGELLGRAGEHLSGCIEQLTELIARADLARDELAWAVLPLARRALDELRRELAAGAIARAASGAGRDAYPEFSQPGG